MAMTPRFTLSLLILGACLALVPGDARAGQWKDLVGRVAPDLQFDEAAQGLDPGTSLLSFRSKQVVLLVFWLRDCPHCKRELPKVQRVHDLYGRSGLTVVSVVHNKYPLAEVLPVMAERGWTFPVARDTRGEMAALYGGGRRPGYFIIGVDGRVKANDLSDGVLAAELARFRLHELGPVPTELGAARDQVSDGDYGAALRLAEAVGRRADASADVRAAVARLATIAAQKLQNRVDRAQLWHVQGDDARAAQEYRGILETFQGTSLEGRAQTLHDQFMARIRQK